MTREFLTPDEENFLRYQRRRRMGMLLGVATILGLFAVTAFLTIPKLLESGKHRQKVEASDLEAVKTRLKKSEVASIEEAVKAPSEGLVATLEVDESLRSRIQPGTEDPGTEDERNFLPEHIIQPAARDKAAKDAAVDAAIAGYRSARSPEEKSAYVINPTRVLPLMRQFQDREEADHDSIGRLVRRTYYVLRGVEYAIDMRRPDGSDLPTFIALRNTGKNGPFKIDWESFVGYSEIGWNELPSLGPDRPVLLRCYATADDYHNFGYSDPARWACIRLTHDGTHQTIYGYVRKGTQAERNILRALRNRSPATLLLRVSRPGNIEAGARQVRINEFLQDTWLVLE